MSNTTRIAEGRKSAYKRPYKTRSQRRERDRRRHDESKDYKFLLRIALIFGLIVVIPAIFAVKGANELSALSPVIGE